MCLLTCSRRALSGNLSNDCDQILSVLTINMVTVVVIILVAIKKEKQEQQRKKETNKQTVLSLSQVVRVFAVDITNSNVSDNL
jgi:hypothetical protein